MLVLSTPLCDCEVYCLGDEIHGPIHARYHLTVLHMVHMYSTSVECLFSVTLLPGVVVQRGAAGCGGAASGDATGCRATSGDATGGRAASGDATGGMASHGLFPCVQTKFKPYRRGSKKYGNAAPTFAESLPPPPSTAG